jgi:hypothetical protein
MIPVTGSVLFARGLKAKIFLGMLGYVQGLYKTDRPATCGQLGASFIATL